jgi:hypothetical protein
MRPGDRKVAAPPPPRLADGRDPVAGALREVRRRAQPTTADEGAAWRRMAARQGHARPEGGGGPGWWWWSAGAVVAAVGLLVLGRAGWSPAGPDARTHAALAPAPRAARAPEARPNVEPALRASAAPRAAVAPPSSAAPEPTVATAAPPVRLALAARPVPLPAGPAALEDEATVEAAPGTAARAATDGALVRVVLDRGEVRLHVQKRVAGGPGFEVDAGPYRFRVLGTRFRVAHRAQEQARGSQVELWVEEGRVSVARGARALGVIEAGGHWSADQTPAHTIRRPPLAAASVPPPAPAPAPVPARARCGELASARETAGEAVSCYLAQAAGGDGIAAETALYEVARLRRDALRDGAGALEAFRQYRDRFPRGMLRAEVDLSIVELLPKLNRHHEALEEIGRLLAEDPGRERAAELQFLRGNIYREVLEDYGRAERDYAAVEAAHAPLVGDATFFRGVCLQALGRTVEARASLDRYLASGAERFADEARRRLARLPR